MPHSRLSAALALALLVPGLLLAGCGRGLHGQLLPNQRPTIALSQAPTGGATPYFYRYDVWWTGDDPDGHVDHYRYVVDPPTRAFSETSWVATEENRHTFTFQSRDIDSLGNVFRPGGYHVVVVEAVDDQGLASLPAIAAFRSNTVAPDVRIFDPSPSRLIAALVPPSVRVQWSGHDPDGLQGNAPRYYKYKLFKEGATDVDFAGLVMDPDSLRRRFAPDFTGWDSTTSNTSPPFTNLVPGSRYLFAVIAIDDAGAYSPVFSLDLNMLIFQVGFPAFGGPVITMYNDLFSYTYTTGGYFNDPRFYVPVDVPSGIPITLYWSAKPGTYSPIKQYRWAMDIQRLDDDTPREGPGDTKHWSFPALSLTQATVGPFTGDGDDAVHNFFIEAEDDNGLKSLGIVQLRVIRPDFDRPLLFVNDTRFGLDQAAGPDSVRTAVGAWPCEAELDTFLYARGGVRWRSYPPGSISSPGIFSGYDGDTLNTSANALAPVPLSKLAHYRHVVWMTSANPSTAGFSTLQTATLNGNPLAVYARMGGKVWLSGGGAARATLLPFNVKANDGRATVFANDAGELVPGRFMYDLAFWQSEISCLAAVGANRNPGLTSPPGGPDYSSLPQHLLYKDPATDPLPPLRGSDFYTIGYDAEYLTKPNTITEPVPIDPDSSIEVSAMDTLYNTSGSAGAWPVMTLYRARNGTQFLFSGFPLWYFSRAQAEALGDWVLGTLWGLPQGAAPTMRAAPGPRLSRAEHLPLARRAR